MRPAKTGKKKHNTADKFTKRIRQIINNYEYIHSIKKPDFQAFFWGLILLKLHQSSTNPTVRNAITAHSAPVANTGA